MNWAQIAAIAVAAAVLGWVAWISMQSLRQALALNAASKTLACRRGRVAALRGRVRVSDPVHTDARVPCLWKRQVIEEVVGDDSVWPSNRRGGWRRTSDRSQTAGFVLLVGREQVEVGEPTEVQGTERRVDYSGGDFLSGAGSRATEWWLPVVRELTALGRLEQRPDGWHLVRDATLGLLLSPHPPEGAASREFVKGLLGILAIAAGIGATIWLCRVLGGLRL